MLPQLPLCLARGLTFALAGLLVVSAPAFADANGDLIAAAARGEMAKVVMLLGKGGDVNARDAGGYTPLIWAALSGHDAVVGELLRRGADVRARDKEGYTALMWAAQNHRADAARALLTHGANPNEADKAGYVALTWAAQDGQPGMAVDLLLAHADPNVRDHAGYTPLMWAAQQGHNSVVKALMGAGADPTVRDAKGFTALDLAVAFNRDDVTQYLTHMAPHTASLGLPTRAYYGAAPVRRRGLTVVGTFGPNDSDQSEPAPQAYVQAAAWRQAVGPQGVPTRDPHILTFDLDHNRVVDGRDWLALSPARRIELCNLVVTTRMASGFPVRLQSVEDKLAWVYSDPTRLTLPINAAFDLPQPSTPLPRW